jgi:hypothetical protein
MKALLTAGKRSAVLMLSLVMEVSSVIKGGMGFVVYNLGKKASSILTLEESKTTAANSMISSFCWLLPVVSRSKATQRTLPQSILDASSTVVKTRGGGEPILVTVEMLFGRRHTVINYRRGCSCRSVY